MYYFDSKSLARQIDVYCLQNGIKKEQFYDESGISSATLSQWRKGSYAVSSKSVRALENYLGYPVQELMDGRMSKKEEPAFSEDELSEELQILRDSPQTRALLRTTKGLKAWQLETVQELAESLRKSNESGN